MKVPWLPKQGIAGLTTQILDDYQAMAGYPLRPPIPVDDVVERYFKLRLSFEDLVEILGIDDVLGATYVEQRLVCIDERLLDGPHEGRLAFTCAHELGHWVLHRHLVEKAARRAGNSSAIVCRISTAKEPIEWQADYFAACMLMPEAQVIRAFHAAFGIQNIKIHNERSSYRGSRLCFEPSLENWPYIAAAVCEVGGFDNVSKQAMIIRLQELGLLVNFTGAPMSWKRAVSSFVSDVAEANLS
jgi:hypothetical protein